MKFGKAKLLILPLLLTSAVVPFTACSVGKPYQNLTPGDKVVGLNHKNVSYLKANVINQCNLYGSANISSSQFDAYLFQYSNDGSNLPNAATLIYWEIIWGMCQQESGELDLVQGDEWTNFFPSMIKTTGATLGIAPSTTITIGNVSLPHTSGTELSTFLFTYTKAVDNSIDCVIQDRTQETTFLTWKSRFFLNTLVTD